jgi:hypothetical protein
MLRFDPCKSASAAEKFFETDGILRKSSEDFLIQGDQRDSELPGQGYKLAIVG